MRHAIARAAIYAWHSESWRVAELLFEHSAALFSNAGHFEEAAHDHLRAAVTHSKMGRYFLSVVAGRIGSALEAFGAIEPPPPGVVADAEILRGEAIALGRETPGSYMDRGL